MNDQFATLYRRMCNPTTFEELQAIHDQLKAIGDFNHDLLAAMEKELLAQNWGCLCKLIWAIPQPTPKAFSGFLCKLLNEHRRDEILEAVADAMFSLKDENTVPSLIGVLDHHLVGDVDYHFNRKIIHALGNIGSAEAIKGIELAFNSPEEIIKRAAQTELRRLVIP
jgi:hypothetical protein